MKKITLLSCQELEGFIIDEDILVKELESRGHEVQIKPWENFKDEGEDLFIIRTTWNYTDHLEQFIKTLEPVSSRLLNPIEIVKWNSNKKYLLELKEQGVPVMPLKIVSTQIELEAFINDSTDSDFIIKPLESAGAKGLIRFDKNNIPKIKGPMILQKFYPEILSGEISLFYFNQNFSYAIKKTPKEGEIRVQEEFGGIITPYTPTESELAMAELAVAKIPAKHLYARVDIVPDIGIIELECIEPSLYFSSYDKSAVLFCDAIEELI